MSLYSAYWYRVADIKPSLRSHVRVYRHIYRGKSWYVLQDPSSSRQHRFNRAAYLIIGLMNGNRTVRDIWDRAAATLGDDVPSQDETIQLLAKLHAADVLVSDIPPDSLEMFQRQDRQRAKWRQRLMNPLALRFPLFDPDRFLLKMLPLIRLFAGRAGALLWCAVVGSAAALTAVHWSELTYGMADRVLTPENLLLLWFTFPLVKLLHELGHAFAARIWGGEVHEMGLMLLVFTPIPYVEASASAAFPEKRRRIAVAAAGMAIELFVAALALFIWLSVEPGQVRNLAFNVMLISGVSTLLFNGNPLLRFDGYYVLADFLEIPNLAQRSTRYLGYLLQRYLFGVEDAVSPVTARGERGWFVVYGIAAFFYRLFIMAVLALSISAKYLAVGVGVAVWAICTQIVLPTIRHSHRFYASIGGRRKRTRFVSVTAGIVAALAIMLFAVPFPLRTRAQGVVSLPENSRVRAGTDCFVTEIVVSDGSMVERGDPLISCEDPHIQAESRVLAADLAGAQARYNAEPLQSRVQREILKQEMAPIEASLARVRERIDQLTVRSPNRGRFVLPEADNLPGRFVKQGDLLGYIMGAAEPIVVVVVGQADIALVQGRSRAIELRLAGRLDTPLAATIGREVPAASDSLPSPVLGTVGGGNIPVDPDDPKGLQTMVQTFQIEMLMPGHPSPVRIGERAYARIDHGYEPLALQWYRRLRQLFLRRFHV